jgi:hypothetical protein
LCRTILMSQRAGVLKRESFARIQVMAAHEAGLESLGVIHGFFKRLFCWSDRPRAETSKCENMCPFLP